MEQALDLTLLLLRQVELDEAAQRHLLALLRVDEVEQRPRRGALALPGLQRPGHEVALRGRVPLLVGEALQVDVGGAALARGEPARAQVGELGDRRGGGVGGLGALGERLAGGAEGQEERQLVELVVERRLAKEELELLRFDGVGGPQQQVALADEDVLARPRLAGREQRREEAAVELQRRGTGDEPHVGHAARLAERRRVGLRRRFGTRRQCGSERQRDEKEKCRETQSRGPRSDSHDLTPGRSVLVCKG